MDKIKIKFENCYGIHSLSTDIDFGKKHAVLIYAPNGTMKTSFAKTFQDYSAGQETKDRIHTEKKTVRDILDGTGNPVPAESIFVVEPYVSSYESNRISTLLANRKLKQEYEEILKKINLRKADFIKSLKDTSGASNNVEDIVSLVFTKETDNFLRAVDRVKNEIEDEKDSKSGLVEIPYKSIFNDKVEKFLATSDFKDRLKEYTENYDGLLAKSRFFKKGIFNHYQAGEIAKQLNTHGFFKAEHSIYLNSAGEEKKITSESELKDVIAEEMADILSNEKLKKSFDAIDSKLKANADLRSFREFLLANQQIIPQLSNTELLREKLWKAYFVENYDGFKALLQEYDIGKKRIEEITKEASEEATKWQDVINIFNRRFSVPFKVSIENKQDVILKSVTPNISFEFTDEEENPVPVDRSQLVEVLSNGEKRALYILNIIFEVEARKEAGIQTLFVVDDIADSFDYKNKYAIIEYLHDILHEGNSRQIILTHNYDFYRTVWKRLQLGGANFHVSKTKTEITLVNESMYKDPFEKWKNSAGNPNKESMLIAMIPFVRNLSNYCGHSTQSELMTSLLHIKDNTGAITVADLANAFNAVLQGVDFSTLDNQGKLVLDLIYEEAEKISNDTARSVELESKVVLSIAIRLKAENYMIAELLKKGTVDPITKNQTATLIRMFKASYGIETTYAENIRLMDKVNLMTPENIHLNSFMFEPILDMSGEHLVALYSEVKSL